VELDPNFARAYRALSALHWNLNNLRGAQENARRAYELRDRASELEQFDIDEFYYSTATEELGKAIEVLEMCSQIYPGKANLTNLSLYYRDIGNHDKALEKQIETVQHHRNSLTLNNLAGCYVRLGHFADARATLEEAISEGKENAEIHRTLYAIAFLEGDSEAMKRHSEWVEQHPDESGMSNIRRNVAYYHGRLQEGRRLLEDRVISLKQQGRDGAAVRLFNYLSWWEVVFGNLDRAKNYARRALEISSDNVAAAFALAAAGELEEAERIAVELAEKRPKATLLHGRDIPTIRSNIELWRGNPEKAIEILRPAKRFEVTNSSCILTRGRAFLALKRGEEAAAEFQKILDHRGITGLHGEYPVAIVELARAKALMGDEAGARKSYEEFLTLWKNADPDVPILQEAKAEYDKLIQ
jgi:tetratricopeptide (TPR) repeat protein